MQTQNNHNKLQCGHKTSTVQGHWRWGRVCVCVRECGSVLPTHTQTQQVGNASKKFANSQNILSVGGDRRLSLFSHPTKESCNVCLGTLSINLTSHLSLSLSATLSYSSLRLVFYTASFPISLSLSLFLSSLSAAFYVSNCSCANFCEISVLYVYDDLTAQNSAIRFGISKRMNE